MNRTVLLLLVLFGINYASGAPSSLEDRVSALEKEVSALKEENKQLRASAFELLKAQLDQRERENARWVYRTQILPMVTSLLKDFGSEGPKLPKEEEINTLAEAYRPFIELMTSLGQVADVAKP